MPRKIVSPETDAMLDEVIAYYRGDYLTPEALTAAWHAGIFNQPLVETCPDCGRSGCQLGYVKGHPLRGLPLGVCQMMILASKTHKSWNPLTSPQQIPMTEEEYFAKFSNRQKKKVA
jgi:hypothetical protein